MVFFFAYIAGRNISTSITNSQNAASNCVSKAVTELSKFESDQQTALTDALCAYTDAEVAC